MLADQGAAPGWLLPASLAYLALPTAIFALGWTRTLVAAPAAVAVLIVVSVSCRRAISQPHLARPRATTAAIRAAATGTGLLTGAGGFLPQTWDWIKHKALMRDLVVEPWPVVYDVDGQTFRLTYYIGYYLPAATVGKVAGWEAANGALLLWSILGLGLAFNWFVTLTGANSQKWVLIAFLGFSGLDIVGRLVLGPLLRIPNPTLPSDQLDWWAVVGKFPNHLTSVMWAPHHALVGWIGAGIVLHLARQRDLSALLPVVLLAGLISPFVAIGLLPLLGLALAPTGLRVLRSRLSSALSPEALFTLVATMPVLLYSSTTQRARQRFRLRTQKRSRRGSRSPTRSDPSIRGDHCWRTSCS